MGAALQIVQPKALKDGFEVHAAGDLLGSLICSGYFKSKADAKAGRVRWKFVGSGVLRQKITVYNSKGTQKIGVLRSTAFGSGGSIELDGQKYNFVKANIWKQHYVWRDDQGPVLEYKVGGVAKLIGEVEVFDDFETDDHCLLLTLLGLYKLKLDIDMSSTASGIAALSIVS